MTTTALKSTKESFKNRIMDEIPQLADLDDDNDTKMPAADMALEDDSLIIPTNQDNMTLEDYCIDGEQSLQTPTKDNTGTTFHNDVTITRCSPRLNGGKSTKKTYSDNATVSQDGKVLLYPNLMFETAAELNDHIQNYAKQNGFLISKAHTYYDCETVAKTEAARQRFPTESFNVTVGKDGKKKGPPQRGRFRCNAAKVPCNWSVNFTHAKLPAKDGIVNYKYVIKPEGFNLVHTPHRLLAVPEDEHAGSYSDIFSERQLNAEEKAFICSQALYSSDNVGKIRLNMQRKFPNRTYSADLLKRVTNKYRDDFFGKGRDQINELISRGLAEKERGGAFEHNIDDSLRLKAFILQTKEMREYAPLYNDFVILDGTHGTNKYGLILEPPTLVDCLGRSVIAGIPICESEQNAYSGKILKTLGLVRKDGVLMTDEGSAFIGLAERLGMRHVLCSFHYQNKTKTVGGLGDYKQRFQDRFNNLIYFDYQNNKAFDEAYESLEKKVTEKYPDAKDALRLLTGIYKVRHKVCCTFTKELFTCGHTSTGRGEGTNSSIKARGDLKREMQGYGLFQLVEHIIAIFKRRQSEALTEIIKKIQKPEVDCSDYVYKAWSKNIVAAPDFSNAILDETASQSDIELWIVTSHKNSVSTVRINSDGQHPTCTCGMYCSTLIPCPCICAIYQRKGRAFFKAKDLHPRWRLDYHPLWKVAHQRLNIALPVTNDVDAYDQAVEIDVTPCDNDTTTTLIPRNVFDAINCPPKSTTRYTRLKESFDEIVSYAKNNPMLFRHASAVLIQEATYCREYRPGNFDMSNVFNDANKNVSVTGNQDTGILVIENASTLMMSNVEDKNESVADNLDTGILDIENANSTRHALPPHSKLERKRARLTDDDVSNKFKFENKNKKKKK